MNAPPPPHSLLLMAFETYLIVLFATLFYFRLRDDVLCSAQGVAKVHSSAQGVARVLCSSKRVVKVHSSASNQQSQR